MNFLVLGVTTFAALIFWFSPSPLSAGACTLWLGFIMMANALLHLSASILGGRYVPGLVTAAALYLPYYMLLMRQIVKRKFVKARTAILLSLIGSVPMFVQGYRYFFSEADCGDTSPMKDFRNPISKRADCNVNTF